jgi:hypothetical protein
MERRVTNSWQNGEYSRYTSTSDRLYELYHASNFQCELIATQSNWTATRIDYNATLQDWEDTLLGSIQDFSPDDYSAQLERILNSISMIAGSGNQHT